MRGPSRKQKGSAKKALVVLPPRNRYQVRRALVNRVGEKIQKQKEELRARLRRLGDVSRGSQGKGSSERRGEQEEGEGDLTHQLGRARQIGGCMASRATCCAEAGTGEGVSGERGNRAEARAVGAMS